ncbi:ECM5 (YMR176W) [Zygosaccharomyces parabailii]|nr:ECM5 (YMR176W) [Zygosaccharomyces parabailii]CDH14877.1 uncharacterized protein ZBAI_06663 [Zygosaccharomyces bailii ISA1307]
MKVEGDRKRKSNGRSMPVFDLSQVSIKKVRCPGVEETLFDQGTQLHYRLGAQSVPSFQLEQEFPDPVKFYEKVRPLGERYGAVKVRMVGERAGTAPDPEHFWFQTRTQHLRSAREQRREVLQFHRKLYECHWRLGHHLHKVPSIDKRTLDLYRLWECVQLRGGYHAVCQRKLWAQIGREMGYSGRIMSSLSTSLRSAYAKVLLDFESDPQNAYVPAQSTSSGIYSVVNSAEECSTLRDFKRVKGFSTNYSPQSTHLEAATVLHGATTLPGYDWEMWQTGMEIYDSSDQETKTPPVYNMKQYYDKSQVHLAEVASRCGEQLPLALDSREWEQEAFEKWYFAVLANPSLSTHVDTAVSLSSAAHNFGELSGSDPGEVGHVIRDLWNLDNLPLSHESMLRHLELDWGNFTHAAIDVGMLFSTKGWGMEPLDLPSLTYNHVGSTKIWYVVPPEHCRKFEQLLRDVNSAQKEVSEEEETGSNRGSDLNAEADLEFRRSDIYKSFLEINGHDYHSGSSRMKSEMLKLLSDEAQHSEEDFSFLPGDLQIAPHVFEKHGIKVFKITQECGTYIFRFPQSYTSTVDSSFCVSKRARFAPVSWLGRLSHTNEGTQAVSELPKFLPFQFLMNIVLSSEGSDEREAKTKGRKLLEPFIRKELLNREKLNQLQLDYVVVEDKFDYVSDLSLKAAGASKIVVDNNGDSISLRLDEFLQQVTAAGDGSLSLGGKELGGMHVCLHIYYSDSILLSALGEQVVHSQSAAVNDTITEKLDTLVNVNFKDRRIPVEHLKQLFSGQSTMEQSWRGLLMHVEALRKECCVMLDKLASSEDSLAAVFIGKGLNLVELQGVQDGVEVGTLHKLQLQLQTCSVDFPEMSKIFQLCEKVSNFQMQAEQALCDKNLQELERCYRMGFSCGIKSKYMGAVAFWICKLHWLRVYQETFVEHLKDPSEDPLNYSLDCMEWFLIYGTKYCGPNEVDKLKKVRSHIMDTRRTRDKISKIFKARKPKSKFLVKDVVSVLELINKERLPIDAELVKLLRSIIDSIQQAKSEMIPLQNLLSINQPFVDNLRDQIKENSLEALKLFSTFDGGFGDKRICMRDAIDNKYFSKLCKPCKLWLSSVSRLCGRGNLEKLVYSVSRCLDLELDTYPALQNDSNQNFYCFCRQDDIGGTMIECELCKEWYHVRCLRKDRWKLPEESAFICSICSNNDEVTHTIEFSSVADLIIDSLELKLVPDRDIVSSLFSIYGKMLIFQNRMQSELFKDGKVEAGVTTNKIKFFLRKAQGSKCSFGSLTKSLQDRCRAENVVSLDDSTKNESADSETQFSSIADEPVSQMLNQGNSGMRKETRREMKSATS